MTNSINKLPHNMPLTTIVRHSIKLGSEKDFEQWVQNISSKVSTFKGFKGRYMVPPKMGTSLNEYTVIFQFENYNTLMTWMESDERKNELEKLKPISENEMELKHLEGIDFWFTTPNETTRPPKWKMSILTWVAVFPMVIILLKLYGKLFPRFSSTLIVLFVTLTLVALLTWVLMPNLTKIFKKWLY